MEKDNKIRAPKSESTDTEQINGRVKLPWILTAIRIIAAAAIVVYAMVAKIPYSTGAILCAVAVCVAGFDIVAMIASDIQRREYVGENILIFVAALISFAIGRAVEGAWAVIIFRLALTLRDYAGESTGRILLSSGANQCDYRAGTQAEDKAAKRSQLFVTAILVVCAILLVVLTFVVKLRFFEVLRRISAIMAIGSFAGLLYAMPYTFLAGMAMAKRNGVAFKNSTALEKLSDIKVVAIDKLGVITNGVYAVEEIKSDKMDPNTFLKVAAFAAGHFEDKVFKAVKSAYDGELPLALEHDVFTYPNKGVSVLLDGLNVLLGREALFNDKGIALPIVERDGEVLYMAVNEIYAGHIILKDSVARDAEKSLKALYSAGVDRVAMLSSDSREKDRRTALELGISEYYAECSEEKKAAQLAEIKQKLGGSALLAYVSAQSGADEAYLNADLGICVSGENDNAQLTVQSLGALESAFGAAGRTKKLLLIEGLIAVTTKLALVTLAGFGLAPLWFTVFMDSCVTLGLIIDSMGKPSK